MGRIEVVLGGQGGQGIRFAGMVLGQACAETGRHIASSASYGPEVRGTFIRSEVVISDEPISYPLALQPQYVLVLTQEAYDRLKQEVADDGWMLFDSEAVTPWPEAPFHHWPLPIMTTAAKMGHPEAANMVMLGAFCALSKLVGLDMIKQALPTSHRQVNEAALDCGFTLADMQPDRSGTAKAEEAHSD